jgi:hypothetical protein
MVAEKKTQAFGDVNSWPDCALYAAMAFYERRIGGVEAVAQLFGQPSGWDWREHYFSQKFPNGIPEEDLRDLQIRFGLLQ